MDGPAADLKAERRSARSGHGRISHHAGGIRRRALSGSGSRREHPRRLLRHDAGVHPRRGRGAPRSPSRAAPEKDALRRVQRDDGRGDERRARDRRAHQSHREEALPAGAAGGRYRLHRPARRRTAGRRRGHPRRQRRPARARRAGDDAPHRQSAAGGRRSAAADRLLRPEGHRGGTARLLRQGRRQLGQRQGGGARNGPAAVQKIRRGRRGPVHGRKRHPAGLARARRDRAQDPGRGARARRREGGRVRPSRPSRSRPSRRCAPCAP